VSLAKFLNILAITGALSAYGAWLHSQRRAPVRAVPTNEIPLLRLSEAEQLWKDKTTLFVDARSWADYEYGHIAGAVLLPEEEFEERFGDLKAKLERARAIVVYCKNIDCAKSLWVALRLRNHGLIQVKIYPAGWNEWHLGGLPIQGNTDR